MACASVSLRLIITVSRTSLQNEYTINNNNTIIIINTGDGGQSAGISAGRAVRRSFVEVSGRDVHSSTVRRELEYANTTASVRRRLGVAGTLAT